VNDEGKNKEYKSTYTPEIKKEIVAFANSSGGELFIGIDDNGKVVGVDKPDFVLLQVTSTIRDSIKPDITIFCDAAVVQINEKSIIKVTVARGSKKPYYISEKGMKPTGVYVRQGSSSVPASEEMIRKMIKETDSETFEEGRSFSQSLTFEYAKKIFHERNIEFSEKYFLALKIKNADEEFTNLGLLISDQCPFTVKAASFSDNDDVQDRRVFAGSLLKQADEAFAYLELNNKIATIVEGLLRLDKKDYAETVLREALINALVHRDYAYSSSIAINIHETRIEFVSIGGIPGNLTVDEIKVRGVSLCRNERLAAIFYRLKLIEAYGWGLSNIFKAYGTSQVLPEIIATQNTFTLVIPNTKKIVHSSNEQEQKIIKFIKENKSITSAKAQELLCIKQARASVLLKDMQEKKLISTKKNGRSVRYELATFT